MKKLMTMIAAVATAFGLYTANADSSYYSTSFEPGYDSGCEGTTFDLEEAGWTEGTTTEETLDLGEYKTGEGYAYPKTGKGLRRDALFLGNDTNTKYLKLETGSSSVGKTIGTGEIFIDQTVQFTGFEEFPAADAINGQIAIWASAIEADEKADPAIAGDTNLYVRVGTGSGYEDVKIDIPFNPDNWYRLTIKSIGDVIDSAKGDEHQAGFLVYINGEPATTSAKYSTIADHFNGTAAGYYAKGQLFTGMGDTAAFTTVAFQGLGAIDDFVTSVEAPDFAAEVPFSIAAVNGATPIAAVAIDGQDEIPLDLNDLKVMPGTTVKVTYAPAAGWKLTTDTYSVTVENADQVIDGSSTILPIEGYATLNGAIKGEAELDDMMANLAANDTVAFLKEGVVTNGEEDVFYAFNTNTTIAVDANGDWTLTILNSAVETPSAFTIYTDIANNITAVFESGDQLSLYGVNIAAGVTVDATDSNGAVSIDAAITVAGTLAATTLTPNGYITLEGAGAVWSAAQLSYAGDESIFTNEKVAESGDAQSGYTYTIATAPTTGFMVILAGETEGEVYPTLAEAVAAANNDDTIKLLSDETVTGICEITKSITLDLNGKTLTGGNTSTDTSKMIVVCGGATLTIDGTTAGSAAVGGIYAGKSTNNNGNIVVNGGSYSWAGVDCVFSSNGTCTDSDITINNATVSSPSDIAIYFAAAGDYEIKNSTVTGYTAIYQKAGSLTIDATSVITATGDTYVAPKPNTSGAYTTGDAIVLDSNTAYAGNVALTIASGAKVTKVADGAAVIRETVTSGNASTTLLLNPGDVTDIAVTDSFAEKVASGDATLVGFVAVAAGKVYPTLAAAVAAAAADDTVTLIANTTINAQITVDKAITLDLNQKTVTVADGKTLAINDNVTVTRTTGGVQNLGSISVAAAKTLDMATFGWGAGLIPAAGDQTDGKFVIAGTVKFAAGTDPREMAKVNPGFFTGTSEGAKFFAGEVEYTYTDGEWKLPQTDITVTVKKSDAIASVTYAGTALEFTGNVATLTLPADTPAVTLTLAAVDTIKIPVFTFAKGAGSLGWSTTGKETSYDVAADDTLNFAAEEANAQDPAITDKAAADAVADAATTVEAKAKVTALTTGEGAVGGRALAAWINTKAGGAVDTALAGNFVKASVALDVAPITEATKIEIKELSTGDAGALTFEVDINDVAALEAIKDMVEASSDLSAWEANKLQTTASYVEGKVTITPKAATDKAFMKVVIPPDAK